MAAPATDNEVELQDRRTKVIALYLQSYTQSQIAKMLGVSQPTVSTDIKSVKKEWREERLDTVDEMRTDAAAKFRKIENEAWKAWERSQGIKPGDDGATGVVGDPRFLELARKTNQDFVELFGIAAPQKLEINDVTDRPTGDLQTRALALLGKAATGPFEADENRADRAGGDRDGAGAPEPDTGTTETSEGAGETTP